MFRRCRDSDELHIRRECGVQAFCRRQNLGADGIYFRPGRERFRAPVGRQPNGMIAAMRSEFHNGYQSIKAPLLRASENAAVFQVRVSADKGARAYRPGGLPSVLVSRRKREASPRRFPLRLSELIPQRRSRRIQRPRWLPEYGRSRGTPARSPHSWKHSERRRGR